MDTPSNHISQKAMDEMRLADLLSQIKRLSEDGRIVSLPELCRDCPELLPELERRLQDVHDTGNFDCDVNTSGNIKPSNAHEANPTGATVDGSVSAAKHSLMLGRYRIERLLGRGGFGEVFEARDQLLQRTVAIKTHRPDRHTDEGWSLNLLSEARKLASIEHPNVVRVYDVAEEAGEILIVAAYIDGSDLNKRLQRGRMPLEQGLPIIAGIAEALHHIHLLGLVHRDVKPGNILLDGQNWPYLSDFGVAASEEELLREQPGGVQGTYAYMSPEQVRGDSHLVDARTDVYGLGVVLYEVLTGRTPFKAANADEYREQILNRPPRPPRTIDDTIPAELERICLKCLAKTVDDRYTTASDLAKDLHDWMNRGAAPASEAHPVRPSPQPFRPWKRVAAVTGAFLCIGLAVLVAYRNWPENPQPQPLVGDVGKKKVKAALQPGVWYNLLEEEPTVVLRPERFARQFDPESKEYWWDTKGGCLIRLGSTRSDDYELEVTFEQASLSGLRGLFLGLPPATSESPNVTQCELLAVGMEPLREKTGIIFRARPDFNVSARRMVELNRITRQIGLPSPALSRIVLSVRVKVGQLAWVRSNHKPVEGLIPNPPPKDSLIGDFGVYADTEAGRITKARFKAYNEEK